MYLLNMPARNSKKERYKNQNKKSIQDKATLEDVSIENHNQIDKIRKEIRTS